jgi:type II secretory pathway pseudopilin PulG
MLIVIVIIGILAAALIPRLTGAQAQARDTARLADLNQL